MSCNLTDIEQLVSISRQMLLQARAAAWDDVTRLEKERHNLIGQLFSEPVEESLVDSLSSGIKSVLAIDLDIIALGRVEKNELEQTLRQIEQGKKARKAYDL